MSATATIRRIFAPRHGARVLLDVSVAVVVFVASLALLSHSGLVSGSDGIAETRLESHQLDLIAVVLAAAGDALLSPSVTRRVIDRMARQPAPDLAGQAKLGGLTPREREVLELMARGLSNREIAATLVVEESTIRTHVKRVLLKLGLRDRVQAVIFAYENGINRVTG
jgi:DNA-binding NarL/FixJ family response regulator